MVTAALTNSQALTVEEARREDARRKLARNKLIAFVEYVSPWYQAEPVHGLIAKYLEQVAQYVRTRGKDGIGRLIIEVPPQIGKSELASRHFPAFMLGQEKHAPIQILSYGGELATDFSKKAKEIVESREYQALFGVKAGTADPVMLAGDSRAASKWSLAPPNRGEVIAAGVGGAVTGRASWLTILDDLFKNREEAESEAYRKRVWSWWESVAKRRLAEFGAVVAMMTRWHADDFIGRLLKQEAIATIPENWTVLSLPGLAFEEERYAKDKNEQLEAMNKGRWLNLKDPLKRKAGESIAPNRFSAPYLLGEKSRMNPYEWASLYDQQPKPLSGGFFGREWEIVEKAPEDLIWVRYWDLAVKQDQQHDYTACAAIAYDWEGTLFIRDMVRGKWEWHQAKEQIIETSWREGLNVIFAIEDVAFQYIAYSELIREPRMRGRGLVPVPKTDNKFIYAIPLQTLNAHGKVKLVQGPWISDFTDEASSFKGDGSALHDDQIDTITGGIRTVRYLQEMGMLDEQGKPIEEPADDLVYYDERVEISPV